MIIYDENFNFLGMSSSDLSLLGYDDIESFLGANDDIADLFIKRQGFIHKFNNFSWISYVLNGAAPNKVVSIKHKNENELLATVDITEVQTGKNGKKLYTVELQNPVVLQTGQTFEGFEKIDEKSDEVSERFEASENVFEMVKNDDDSDVKSEEQERSISISFDADDEQEKDVFFTAKKEDEEEKDDFKSIDFESISENDLVSFDSTDKDQEEELTKADDSKDDGFTITFDEDEADGETSPSSQADDINNLMDKYEFDKDQAKGHFNEYSVFVFSKLPIIYKYIEEKDGESLNEEILKLIGASNVLGLDNICQKLSKIKKITSFDKKRSMIDEIEKDVSNLTNKIKG